FEEEKKIPLAFSSRWCSYSSGPVLAIAKAHARKATVVTHEMPNPESKNRVLIPNICKTFNIAYINTFDMLREMAAKFVYDNSRNKQNA
ncbi:MAG: DUF4411 family protein, partial [Magnetococcales bacterium]|nr:DUF4411 family protein [Magnetococcales bacterium]